MCADGTLLALVTRMMTAQSIRQTATAAPEQVPSDAASELKKKTVEGEVQQGVGFSQLVCQMLMAPPRDEQQAGQGELQPAVSAGTDIVVAFKDAQEKSTSTKMEAPLSELPGVPDQSADQSQGKQNSQSTVAAPDAATTGMKLPDQAVTEEKRKTVSPDAENQAKENGAKEQSSVLNQLPKRSFAETGQISVQPEEVMGIDQPETKQKTPASIPPLSVKEAGNNNKNLLGQTSMDSDSKGTGTESHDQHNNGAETALQSGKNGSNDGDSSFKTGMTPGRKEGDKRPFDAQKSMGTDKPDFNSVMQRDPSATRDQAAHAQMRAGVEPARAEGHAGRMQGANSADLVDNAVSMTKDNNKLSVTLEPKGLGKLDINLSLDKGIVNAHINAADDKTRNLLENNMHQIMNTLTQEGLSVGGFSVSLKNQGNESHNPAAATPTEVRTAVSLKENYPSGQYISNGLVSIFV